MLYDMDRDKNIDLLGKKVYILCLTHIAVGHRIQGGGPAPSGSRPPLDIINFVNGKMKKVYEC